MILANGVVRFPITILYCVSGLIVGTLAMSNPEFLAKIPADNPDWMMPIFILDYLPHGLIGLLVVAILSAAMSSLSSAINSLSAVSIEDYSRISNKELDQPTYLKLAKYLGLIWGAITLILSLYAGDIAPTIIEAINKVGSLFYGPILAVFLIAVVSKRSAALHANIGLISGVLINLLVSVFAPDVFWFWWNFIGFVATAVITLTTSIAIPREVNEVAKAQNAETISNSILTGKDIVMLLSMFVVMVLICLAIPSIFS